MTQTASNKAIKDLITTKQLAEQLGVAEITIWRWRQQGMPFKQVGPRSIRFDIDAVNEWVLSQGQTDAHK